MTDVPRKARGKSGGQKLRAAIEILERREEFLRELAITRRAQRGRDAGRLEQRDADDLGMAIAALRGVNSPQSERDRERIVEMLRTRHEYLAGLVAKRIASGEPHERERREVKALALALCEIQRVFADFGPIRTED